MNVVRHEPEPRPWTPTTTEATGPLRRPALADRKISVPTILGLSGIGAPLGEAANFNNKKFGSAGAEPKDAESSEGGAGASRDPDRVASLLASSLRKLMRPSQSRCRLWVVANEVTVQQYTTGKGGKRIVFEGLHTCKSNNCPLCVRKWERTRAAEIQSAVSNWLSKERQVLFSTFTMRHHPGMPLALQHRLLTKAFGELWSGSKGKKLAAAFGGKPESIRAHDITWSLEEWWHPHLHALLMLLKSCDRSLSEMRALLMQRWREALVAALKSMKRLIASMLGEGKSVVAEPCRVQTRFRRAIANRGTSCRKGRGFRKKLREDQPIEPHDQCVDCISRLGLSSRVAPEPGERVLHQEYYDATCSACMFGTAECPNHRERATRMFGTSLIPGHQPLKDSLIRVRKMLRPMTVKNILPSVERSVVVDRVLKGDHVSSYLPKLGAIGFELAATSTKLGWTDERGVTHYGKWEVAQLCLMHGDKLRGHARSAWKEMFDATFGTATITFSDRAAMGLGADPYANDCEPPEIDIDLEATMRVLGRIAKPTWCGMARAHSHTLLAAIHDAYRAGVLESMPWFLPPMGGSGEGGSGEPRPHDPPDIPPELSAEDRARWKKAEKSIRADWRRQIYDATQLERGRRWEVLRALSEVQGPEAWRELTEALGARANWLDRGVVVGAEHWQTVNAIAERRDELEAERTPEMLYEVRINAQHRLAADNALSAIGLSLDELRARGLIVTMAELGARRTLADTLMRSGLDRPTAERLAVALVRGEDAAAAQ